MRMLMLSVIAVLASHAAQSQVLDPANDQTPAAVPSATTAPAPATSAPAATNPAAEPSSGTKSAPRENTPSGSSPAGAAPPAGNAPKGELAGKFEIPPSYKPELRGDATMYCRKEVQNGTRFKKKTCYTLADLKEKVARDQAQADDLTRRARVCSSAAVCAGN